MYVIILSIYILPPFSFFALQKKKNVGGGFLTSSTFDLPQVPIRSSPQFVIWKKALKFVFIY